MRIPDSIAQTEGLIPINAVEILSSMVKEINDTTKLAVMMYGRRLFESELSKLPPTITGSSGNIQGAKTLNMPANNDKRAVITIPKC